MADKHIRVYYGKYLDDITNEINNDHILISDCGDISLSIEPGEPNIPTVDDYELVLANLDPTGSERFPFSFWESQARTVAEGATSDMEIFFKIDILDNTEFIGMFKKVTYSERRAKCYVEIKDFTFVLQSEQRKLLKTIDLGDCFVLNTRNENNPNGFNDLPQLKDLTGATMSQESITFQLDYSAAKGPNNLPYGPTVDETETSFSARNRRALWRHLGVPTAEYGGEEYYDFSNFEQIRNTYVKIGEHTIFTRVKFWTGILDFGESLEHYMTVYHNGESIDEDGNVPRGRFFKNEDLDIIEQEDTVQVKLFDYDVGNSPDILLKDSDLPAYDNFIFGCAFNFVSGGFIQLTTEEYTYFDLISETTSAINAAVATRYGSASSFQGELEITSGSNPAAEGSTAEALIGVRQAPFDDETLQAVLFDDDDNEVRRTFNIFAGADDTPNEIAQNIAAAINNDGWFSARFDAADTGSGDVEVTTDDETAQWNGYYINLKDSFGGEPKTMIIYSGFSGGVDGSATSEDVDLLVGGQVVGSATVDPGQSSETIASNLSDITDTDDYTFTYDAGTPDLVLVQSSKGVVETVSLDPKSTGVTFNSGQIETDFEIFDTSKLLDKYRLAFYSDPVMFGWIDKNIIEVLIGTVWQTSAYFYATPDGKIAYHSRDYHESLPDDLQDGSFATEIPPTAIKPDGNLDEGKGFKSYHTDIPTDIIGLINITSDDNRTINANKDGVISKPSTLGKKIKSSNFRLSNLGHPQKPDQVDDEYKILRFSPENANFPFEELEDFLPTAETQLINFATSQQYPLEVRPIRLKYKDFQNLNVGDYAWTIDQKLWLVTETTLNPETLSLQLSLEFKKQLFGLKQTFVEDLSLGEEFEFHELLTQTNEESLSLSEERLTRVRLRFEEAIVIAEETTDIVRVRYEEPVSLNSEYTDNEPET